MKKSILMGLVIGVFAFNVQAEECFDMDIGFPCEHEGESAAAVVANSNQTATKGNDQLRLKFISRRPYLNRSVAKRYNSDDQWVGATYRNDQLKDRKSNINMFSRRPYRAAD